MQGIIILQIYIGLLYQHPEQSKLRFLVFLFKINILLYIIVYYIDTQYTAS